MFEISACMAAMAVSLHIPASQSLKEKRRVIKSLKDRIRAGFNVSVSEVGELDKWQSAVLGVCMIANEKEIISAVFEKILSLIEREDEARLINSQIEWFL